MSHRCAPLLHSPLLLRTESPYRFPVSISRRSKEATEGSLSIILASRNLVSEPSQKTEPTSSSSEFTMAYSSAPLIELGRRFRIRPGPELGLLYLLFALTMAVGSIICLAIISIPAMKAIRRLEASMDSLSKEITKEIPGTLLSLGLFTLEIKDLTQQLSNLRQMISGISSSGKRERKQ